MSDPVSLSVHPLGWKGVRDNTSPSRILDEEWVESNNVDSRFARRRKGLTQLALLEAAHARTVFTFRRQDGTVHRGTIMGSGNFYEDAVLKLAGLPVASPWSVALGDGFAVMLNAGAAPQWRDPADSIWKPLQGVPIGWMPKTGDYHMLSRRLFVAPTTTGVDDFAWTNPEFTGANCSFLSGGGGGNENLGGRRDPITCIKCGLGDDTCIYQEDHIYQLRGLDPSSWKPRHVSSDIGAVSALPVQVIGHGQSFVHWSGAYLVNALGAVTFPPLTAPKQREWDNLVRDYGSYLQYAHSSWCAHEHTLYLFLPTSSDMLMGKLWKIYLPDGSITTHDVAAYCSFYSNRQLLVGRANGIIADLLTGNTDLGTKITGMIRSKIYGGTRRTKTWGVQEKMSICYRPLAGGEVQVTPYIYRASSEDPIAGNPQNITLTSNGDMVRATLVLPAEQGWGLQLKMESGDAFEWLGFDVEYQEEDIE